MKGTGCNLRPSGTIHSPILRDRPAKSYQLLYDIIGWRWLWDAPDT